MDPVNVTNFPIRDHKVVLVICCRRWTDLRTGKSFSLPIRWDALQESNEEMEECRLSGKTYVPFRFPNGDTRLELLIRSRYLLFKSADKWTERKKERAGILFDEYPDIKVAYGLSHSLRMIFSKKHCQRCRKAQYGKMVR